MAQQPWLSEDRRSPDLRVSSAIAQGPPPAEPEAANQLAMRQRADGGGASPATGAQRAESRAALSVLDSSIAIVIGPTPPGTGVIADALIDTGS